MSAVVFDYTAWVTRYPVFGSVQQATAQLYFNEATLYVDNTDTSPIPYNPPSDVTRAQILNMATAHIAMLATLDIVGRIDSASEGSVSLTAKYADQTPESLAWWTQTKYGAQAYMAMAPFRRAGFVAGPAPRLNGLYFPAGRRVGY